MLLGPVFDRFAAQSPASVMARATLERALCPQELDALFERCAQRQYTRDLLFPTATDLLSQAVCGTRQSAHAAYEAAAGDVAVSITSVYDKLAGVEPHVAAELVRSCAGRRAPVIGALGGFPEWLPGYRARLLDGNHLAATGHRLKETRACAAGPLPGSCLVVPGAATGPAEGAFPCEGGRARERALLGDVPGAARARDPWLGDRNLCAARFLAGIAARAALFITRAHRQVPLAAAGRLRPCGRVEAGQVWEQAATVTGGGDQTRALAVRCVTPLLDQPTRGGAREVVLLTNLPARGAGAREVARLYRRRWAIEGRFQEMALALNAEVDTLCYPKAALFAFCVGPAASDVLAAAKAAPRAAHGAEAAEEVSGYYLAGERAGTYRGLMIAPPPRGGLVSRSLAAEEFAGLLRGGAAGVRLAAFRRHRRGPKKPPPKRRQDKNRPHVSTARLLERRQKDKNHS